MTHTADVFNYVSVANQNDIQDGTSGKSKSGDATSNLEFLLFLEMFKDKPEMQKLIELADKRRKFKMKNAFVKAAKVAKRDEAGKAAFKTASGRSAINTTVMQNAAAYNRIEMLLSQIKRGKCLNQKNEFGQSAMSLAKARGNMQIVELLSIAQNYIQLLEKNAYSVAKDPTRSHFLTAEQKRALKV